MAATSCSGGVYGTQAVIPGRGVAIFQAATNTTRAKDAAAKGGSAFDTVLPELGGHFVLAFDLPVIGAFPGGKYVAEDAPEQPIAAISFVEPRLAPISAEATKRSFRKIGARS